MTVLSQLYLFGALFLLANLLDALSTYLCLFRLPVEVRAQERNPLFRAMSIEQHFAGNMVFKFALILAGLWLFLMFFRNDPGQGLTAFKILDLIFAFAIINNTYVYISRRITKRKTMTLIGLIDKLIPKCIKWQKVREVISYLLTVGVIYGLSVSIVLWIL